MTMTEKKNIRLVIAYDGGRYCGWQRQKNDPTIQALIEDKIQLMTGEPVTLHASGRTDSGVHALHQICHFVTRTRLDPDSICRGLNSLLPDDIFIREADDVPLDFHARYSAKRKTYEYRILNRRQPDIFRRGFLWHIPAPLDTGIMDKCVSLLVGTHDFSAFRSTGSGNTNPIREMYVATLRGSNEGVLRFIFEADGFLRHMVRNIVGTLVEAGLGKRDLADFQYILKSKDRKKAGVKAPPQGLFLTMVYY